MGASLDVGYTQREGSWFLFSCMDLNLSCAPEQEKQKHTHTL